MATVEIACWVTRDQYELLDRYVKVWLNEPRLVENNGVSFYGLATQLGMTAYAGGVPNRRGCWPARLVVEVPDGD